MTDSVAIFPPGFRVFSAAGLPVSGAKLKFYEAGTTTPLVVYSNSDLSTGSLGAVVTCDSGGAPASGAGAAVLAYTGTAAYKLVITDASDIALQTIDDIKGALDTSAFLTGALVPSVPVLGAKTADYTVVAGDKGKLIPVDATSGVVTITMISAVTAGDGFNVGFKQIGGANAVRIRESGGTPVHYLRKPGQSVWIASNGAALVTYNASRLPDRTDGGVILIDDRISALPGSPFAGAQYIVETGFSIYATGEILQSDGAGSWTRHAPSTDDGLVAYVKDEDLFYAFRGSAWTTAINPATATNSGMVELSTAAETKTATDAARVAALDMMQHHPGVAKAWVRFTTSGGTPTFVIGHNVSATITDNGVGDFTVTFTTAMATANYVCFGFAVQGPPAYVGADSGIGHTTTTTCRIRCVDAAGSAVDPTALYVAFFGHQV